MSIEFAEPFVPGEVVILADGLFPSSSNVLEYLHAADQIICCDGATQPLLDFGREPSLIIGDLDSISPALKTRFSDRLVEKPSQDTNDLTKAIVWAAEHDVSRLAVLGADGGRIDHTIANAGLIAEHRRRMDLAMVTDDGLLIPLDHSARFRAEPGQQVSIFSLSPGTRYSTTGLKYPLDKSLLPTLWSGSLNEVVETSFTVEFDGGPTLVFISSDAA